MITGSMDIYDVGNPNVEAEGIINDAFDSIDKQEVETMKEVPPVVESPLAHSGESLVRKTSLDVCEVEANNIQPNDLRELVEPNEDEVFSTVGDTEKTIVVEDDPDEYQITTEVVDQQEVPINSTDPFDTSAFDSDAFDAFESRFEATEMQSELKTDTVDPFASPFKTAKPGDNTNAFDSFEPFIPKQPENTPFHSKARPKKKDSFEDSDDDDDDSEEEENIKIVIRAKMKDASDTGSTAPVIGKWKMVLLIY